jgi:hypothetical protein
VGVKLPLFYNVSGGEIGSRLTRGLLILQYADDIVIYASGAIRESLQESMNSVDVILSDLGLSISAAKSEVVLFLKKRNMLAIFDGV